MLAMLTSIWPGPERRLKQQPFEGADRRHSRPEQSEAGYPPHWNGQTPDDGFVRWLRAWIAPQTIIVLISFAAMTAVAHHRLSRVELDVADLRASVAREVATLRAERETYYPRRGELTPELSAINRRLESIERTLERLAPRNNRNGEQR